MSSLDHLTDPSGWHFSRGMSVSIALHYICHPTPRFIGNAAVLLLWLVMVTAFERKYRASVIYDQAAGKSREAYNIGLISVFLNLKVLTKRLLKQHPFFVISLIGDINQTASRGVAAHLII